MDSKKRKLIEFALIKIEKGTESGDVKKNKVRPAIGAVDVPTTKQPKAPDVEKPKKKKTGPVLISEAIESFGTTMTSNPATSALKAFQEENSKRYKYPATDSFAIKQQLNDKGVARLYNGLNAEERALWLEGNGFPLSK